MTADPHGHPDRAWTFLTHHAHLLLAIADNPDARVQDLADTVGVSSRAALSIVRDLVDAGYIRRERVGRRNHYSVEENRPFRHPSTAAHSVDELIAVFSTLGPGSGPAPAGASGLRRATNSTEILG